MSFYSRFYFSFASLMTKKRIRCSSIIALLTIECCFLSNYGYFFFCCFVTLVISKLFIVFFVLNFGLKMCLRCSVQKHYIFYLKTNFAEDIRYYVIFLLQIKWNCFHLLNVNETNRNTITFELTTLPIHTHFVFVYQVTFRFGTCPTFIIL